MSYRKVKGKREQGFQACQSERKWLLALMELQMQGLSSMEHLAWGPQVSLRHNYTQMSGIGVSVESQGSWRVFKVVRARLPQELKWRQRCLNTAHAFPNEPLTGKSYVGTYYL